jgi:maltose O-acetyltransferase
MTLESQRAHILSGRMYNDLTPELISARQRAVMLSTAYNDSFGAPQADREALLRDLLDQVGPGAHFEPTFRCEFGYNISVGTNFYANFDAVMLDGATSPSATTSCWVHASGSTPRTTPPTLKNASPAPATRSP